MVKLILFICLVFFAEIGLSQSTAPVSVVWSQCFGGLGDDDIFSGGETYNNGFVMGGRTQSSDGDLIGNNGSFDYWILALDSNREIAFSKSYGGSQIDNCRYAIGNSDGQTYMAFGSSHSINGGDLDSNQIIGDTAFSTFWLLKLDENGEIIFQKIYNGNGVHGGRAMVQTENGYALLGWSTSTNNYFTGNYGQHDAYLMKVDNDGDMQWTKNFGGSSKEECISLLETSDGGYIFSGSTLSNDFDFEGLNHGAKDMMVVKTDSLGNKLWARAYGGEGSEQALGISLDWDGNILVCGEDSMPSGDCNNLNGDYDGWILKLNQLNGDTIWTLNLGGSDKEVALRFLSLPDKGYIGLISTSSTDGLLENQDLGHGDIWLVRLDSARNVVWNKTFGGFWGETANEIKILDNGYMVWGITSSRDGDVVGHYEVDDEDRNKDLWAFYVIDSTLFSADTTIIGVAVNDENKFFLSVYPSPSNDGIFNLQGTLKETGELEILVVNILGEIVHTETFKQTTGTFEKKLNLSGCAKGAYEVIVKNKSNNLTKKIIIQ